MTEWALNLNTLGVSKKSQLTPEMFKMQGLYRIARQMKWGTQHDCSISISAKKSVSSGRMDGKGF
jgi:hypothetical protein